MSVQSPDGAALELPRKIVLVGASVLNLNLLRALIKSVRLADASVVIVINDEEDAAEQLVSEFSALRVCFASDGAPLRPGVVALCRPDTHLLIGEGHFRMVAAPHVNGFRPSLDPFFKSAAANHGSRVVAVLLSCKRCDGLAGVEAVRECGGEVLIPEPGACCALTLPSRDFITGIADYVVPEEELIPTLESMIEKSVANPGSRLPYRDELALETKQFGSLGKASVKADGLAHFCCPECGGPLEIHRHDGHAQFSCRIGHSYSSEALSLEQKRVVERALAIALRSMEDSSLLSKALISMGHPENSLEKSLVQFAAKRADEDAEILRDLLRNHSAPWRDGIKVCSD